MQILSAEKANKNQNICFTPFYISNARFIYIIDLKLTCYNFLYINLKCRKIIVL